jgi:DNA repair protein RadC
MISTNKNHIGHRKRLREKFTIANNAMQDYEILELLLFYVFPQKDTKDLAKTLLNKFKTLHSIIFADKSQLINIEGLGESTCFLLELIRELYSRLTLADVRYRQPMNSIDKVIEYYKFILSNDIREQLRLMLIDNKGKLIEEKQIQVGTVNQSAFYPREIIKLALDHGASAIIIVHNHPSGDPSPSIADIEMTKKLKKICDSVDIALLDHIIIGANNFVSLHKKRVI